MKTYKSEANEKPMQQFEQYWLFAVFCIVIGAVVLRLILREHVTLQSSLWFLLLLVGAAVFAISPQVTVAAAQAMGFTLPSNFFFTLGIGGLSVMHVHTLVMLSRTELRTVTLTQELALLRERVERTQPPGALGAAPAPVPQSFSDAE